MVKGGYVMGVVDYVMDEFLEPEDTLSLEKNAKQEIVENEYHESIYIASKLIQPLENSIQKGLDVDSGTWTAYKELNSDKYAIAFGLNTIDGVPVKAGDKISTGDAISNIELKLHDVRSQILGDENIKDDFLTLNPNQQASILSLVYNVGFEGFKFKNVGSIEEPEWVGTNAYQHLDKIAEDPNAIFDFTYEAFTGPEPFDRQKGQTIKGLTDRRKIEYDLFKQGYNRDFMSFGEAFKEYKNEGEETFIWRGKEYTTKEK
tara:strand:+ start:4245 stop:5024 length:780 start_codon:yes stop_codon:yes gene_type:complete